MKKYYAKENAVAMIEVTGGKLTAKETETVRDTITGLGLKEVSRAEYLVVQATLPPATKHVSIEVGDDGSIVTKSNSSSV